MSNPLSPRPETRLHRNLEVKATLPQPAVQRQAAHEIATEHLGYQNQVDTYFRCENGRLKLREISGQGAQLIWYDRPDDTNSKASDYFLVQVPDGEAMRATLSAALGVRSIVRKRREILLHRYVRIHLDEVKGLGNFLELEAVLGDDESETDANDLLRSLLVELKVESGHLLAGSYADMPAKP